MTDKNTFKLQKGIEKILEKREKRIQELEAKAKPLRELVVSEYFLVKKVIGKTHPTSFNPCAETQLMSPLITYSPHQMGYIKTLTLEVDWIGKQYFSRVPVKTLNFEGDCPVIVGNFIKALIPKYREEKVDSLSHNPEEIFYLNRNFAETESAIEITILSRDKSEKRTDRAADYDRYMK